MPTLVHLLRESARHFPRCPAVLGETISLDHATFGVLSDRVATGLLARGVRTGDRVGLYAPNGPEFALAYAGILKAGASVVPINLLIGHEEAAYILSDSGARGLIAHAALREPAALLPQAAPNLEWVVELGGGLEVTANLAALLGAEAIPPEPVLEPDEALAAILYTSGTTGFPKGAMLTHANLAANVHSVHQAMRWRAGEDRVLVVLPMFHAFAATVGLLTPLTNGCALIPLPRFEPEAVAEAVQTWQATIFLGVPSMYSVLLRLRPERTGLLA